MENIANNVNNGASMPPIQFDLKQFDKTQPVNTNILPSDILDEINTTKDSFKAVPHGEILSQLLERVQPINFKERVYPNYSKLKKEFEEAKEKATNEDGSLNKDCEDFETYKDLKKQLGKMRVYKRHFIVESVEELINLAIKYNWGLCRKEGFVYLYNSAYWKVLDDDIIKDFIRDAAQKMGVDKYTARYCDDKDKLHKQFLAEASLPEPQRAENSTLINLLNGTFEVTPEGGKLRSFNRNDFIRYQLPFEYDPTAKAPLFHKYLDEVQPDRDRQKILAEYIAYVFTKHLKIEKTLLLYGTGANGKSVFFEIINALLGSENVTGYSLQSLTEEKGYHRAKLANSLVNYASEINGKLETSIFKQLVSGEPVEARLPYGQPFILTDYAKLIFNCNELPKQVEHTNAYFRRFLIVPFDETIPEEKQDKELATKIINSELSGVFNWVLEGLERLLKNKKFSTSESVNQQLEKYKLESDNVHLFMEDREYQKDVANYVKLKDLYFDYRTFCGDDGYRPLSKTNFKKRLIDKGVLVSKIKVGNVVYISKSQTALSKDFTKK